MHTSAQIRKQFLDFWKESPRNHKETPDVSLVPNVDSTLLFVNSGMFPLAPYLAGQPHPLGNRLVNIQRCLRTKSDEVEEIGDNRHTLMFEMMGNWSLGDYFKKEQLPWMLELYVERFGLDPHRLYVSVWEGDDKVPRDTEAIEIWKEAFKKYGIDAEFSEDLSQIPRDLSESKTHNIKIFPYGKGDNWWERAFAPGELGGPTSEIFYDLGEIEQEQENYHINDDSGRFVEIGNSVFMEYRLSEDLAWEKLEQSNVDFGGGFERVVMCVQGKKDIYATDIYLPVIERIEEISGKPYKTNDEVNEYTSAFRVVADHGRIVTFLIADGVKPGSKDQGYILRRFIRRLIRFGGKLGIEKGLTTAVATEVIACMKDAYPHLSDEKESILSILEQEEVSFRQTLNRGLKELDKLKAAGEVPSGKLAFYLFETYGFPLEMTLEEFGIRDDAAGELLEEFEVVRTEHSAQSRAGAQQKFAGGLADHSEEVTRLHTAHHLLLKALQLVLGDHVKQRGSNITAERLRIDFTHSDKVTPEQLTEVERIVNEKIEENLAVTQKMLPRDEAEKIGAEMEFGQKYPEIVSVYFIGDPEGDWFSAEFCGGPHASSTGELAQGNKIFKILKEESSSAGIRRIKATLA